MCQWHNCNICSKRTIRCCVRCVNSFCPPHSEGNVRYDKLLGFVCAEHDPVSHGIKTYLLPMLHEKIDTQIITDNVYDAVLRKRIVYTMMQ